MDVPDKPWAMRVEEVLDALGARPEQGLDDQEAERRRDEVGPNRLEEAERRSVLQILWEQVRSVIVLLLLAAGVVSLVMGELADAAAIGVVLLLNTAIGFVAEWRARRSMEALRSMGEVEATVRRSGREQDVDAEALVPGDVVVLEAGDIVPADVRIVQGDGVQVDESALTGESVPVAKQVEPVGEDASTTDQASMAFRGTAVSKGEGVAVVVRTGMRTALGEISRMAEEAEAGQAPLDERLDRLGRQLTVVTVVVAAIVIGAGSIAGRELAMMVQTGVALAVAAIPEGLPIVATVALARGMWRMARHDALVRHLPAVETLGSTTLICTDKTGTLTRNEMRLQTLVTADGERHDVEGLEPEGELAHVLKVVVLANEVDEDGNVSDPMEEALLRAGERLGVARDLPRERLVPFVRETTMVASFHRDDDGVLVAVKGATGAVVDACAGVDDPQRWQERTEELAADGLRVLAVASKRVDSAEVEPYEDLELLGLIGLLDPPREGVADAVRACRDAGIRVVMVTGDHPATARAIAEQVGIRADEEGVVARVSPAQKLELVDRWQEEGEVVAMTGDGVNDAPALRSADVGIAMGKAGTDVAREAADIVLQDDAFETIVEAVRQGRILFGNIRKFVVYLLSGNVGEILLVTAGAVAGLPLPLLPLQILYLNVINDVFPAFALGVGPGSPRVMEEPPRDPEEPLMTRQHWGVTAGYGLMIGAVVFGAFLVALWVLRLETIQAVTVSFLTLSCGRLLHVFNMRDRTEGVFSNDITRNPWVWGSLALCLGLLALAVYVGPLAAVLQLAPPVGPAWAVIGVGSVVPLILGQLWLGVQQRVSS